MVCALSCAPLGTGGPGAPGTGNFLCTPVCLLNFLCPCINWTKNSRHRGRKWREKMVANFSQPSNNRPRAFLYRGRRRRDNRFWKARCHLSGQQFPYTRRPRHSGRWGRRAALLCRTNGQRWRAHPWNNRPKFFR